MSRNTISILMLLVFLILSVSGILSYFTAYTRSIATVHTVFGFLFLLITVAHVFNNNKALSAYFRTWQIIPLSMLVAAVAFFTITDSAASNYLMNYGATSKAKYGVETESDLYTKIEMDVSKSHQLSIELKRAEHFWHPQIAVWTEDTLGNFIETLYITKATAKGIFAGGRTKDNFKTLDTEIVDTEGGFRRVNALPIWSHKRGVVYADGLYAPTFENPMPDGMTGATPLNNFSLNTSIESAESFIVKLEINVAFDDNEYYSAFDFPDDEIFHNGTGQLGQPSIVFNTKIDASKKKSYYLMDLEGHGHHSGQDGKIYKDLSNLTTALQIVELILVGFKKQSVDETM